MILYFYCLLKRLTTWELPLDEVSYSNFLLNFFHGSFLFPYVYIIA